MCMSFILQMPTTMYWYGLAKPILYTPNRMFNGYFGGHGRAEITF